MVIHQNVSLALFFRLRKWWHETGWEPPCPPEGPRACLLQEGSKTKGTKEANHFSALFTPLGAVVKSVPIKGTGCQLGQCGALLAVQLWANSLTSWFLANFNRLLLNV